MPKKTSPKSSTPKPKTAKQTKPADSVASPKGSTPKPKTSKRPKPNGPVDLPTGKPLHVWLGDDELYCTKDLVVNDGLYWCKTSEGEIKAAIRPMG
jgi:hypothetical protein